MSDEIIEFQSDNVGKVKIIYKNGKYFTVKNLTEISVFRKNPSVGCDVEYATISQENEEFGIKSTIVVNSTDTMDVVAIEAYDVVVFGMRFDKLVKRFK